MDPTANLVEQLRLAKRLVVWHSPDYVSDTKSDDADVCRLAELVLALFEWQRRGGFAPDLARVAAAPGVAD